MVRRLHVCSKGADEDTAYGQYVSDIPRAILALLRNIPFVMLTLASASEAMVGTAVAAFSVKFFEAEFSMTPSKTAAALGNIPAPLLLGSVIDGSCLLWQEVCFQRGACLLYNNELLALSMLEFLVPAKTCSILLYYGALTALRSHQGIE
ncbi:hypothetical protein V5799_032142 [Amblyomma americanum]|uniref:Uncharacterized protein n=1 Tax=Amblyomma americanum TaxID=6943 RepID=A0AAQ4DS07_AMBAM